MVLMAVVLVFALIVKPPLNVRFALPWASNMVLGSPLPITKIPAVVVRVPLLIVKAGSVLFDELILKVIVPEPPSEVFPFQQATYPQAPEVVRLPLMVAVVFPLTVSPVLRGAGLGVAP